MTALDHDHVAALLAPADDEATVRAAVAAIAARAGVEVAVVRHEIDLDVPVPLIIHVDAWTRLAVGDVELFVGLRGEAYDRRYVRSLALFADGVRTEHDDVAALAAALRRRLARVLPDEVVRDLCLAALPPVLAAELAL